MSIAPEKVPEMIELLVEHVARLRAALTHYRISRDHRDCHNRTGFLQVDTRCPLCRAADDVLCEQVHV